MAYNRIRNSKYPACESCSTKEIYEARLRNEPEGWPITKQEALRVLCDAGYEILGVVGKTEGEGAAEAVLTNVWEIIDVRCNTCGKESRRSVVHVLASSWRGGEHCPHLDMEATIREHTEFFAAHGLARNFNGYAKLTQPVPAICLVCGTERRVSLSTLAQKKQPCLKCADTVDPDLPHLVYLIHFSELELIKVGITNTEGRDYSRIKAHLAQGGALIDTVTVPNREAAFTVERHVLNKMSGYRQGATARHLPQGGWTETWHDSAPEVDLTAIVRLLDQRNAPGFDRLQRLEMYFEGEPITVDEAAGFVTVQEVPVGDETVHVVELTATREEILQEVRRQRMGRRTGDRAPSRN
ncbi:hypothetical protein [Streptomyces sp. NPDC088910]|uniref:hypothetical protein n=1 Tax=Streptomyces sp. NPDC088910 TaxID=3365911 RepID=UPI0037F91D9C